MGVRPLPALVFAALVTSGCLGDADPPAWPAMDPAPMAFETTMGAVAALAWVPDGATEAVVLYHGASGVKENYWGELSVPGYSTGAWHAEAGRAVYGLDLPGYGESMGPYTFESAITALEEVVAQIRGLGYERVFGLGVSNGALVLGVQQGQYGSFDAVVMIGNGPAASRAESQACTRSQLGLPRGGPCPDDGSDDFWLATTDPVVVVDIFAGYEGMPDAWVPGVGVWAGYTGVFADEARVLPPEATLYGQSLARVEVPALVIVGEHDWFVDSQKVAQSCSLYGGPCEAMVLPDTGHMALHHLDRDEVQRAIIDWFAR